MGGRSGPRACQAVGPPPCWSSLPQAAVHQAPPALLWPCGQDGIAPRSFLPEMPVSLHPYRSAPMLLQEAPAQPHLREGREALGAPASAHSLLAPPTRMGHAIRLAAAPQHPRCPSSSFRGTSRFSTPHLPLWGTICSKFEDNGKILL
ncbi:hypothetical protein E2I00_006054 [Balaenoptera physalus]|uniref:Uncharacterized protein n=1 Tax=Balaenoptera physalus TaxID=9770 RepID=A0A643CFC5_BALPH|nr:hypothetical protein E2I00_006054 [Balaenoptera physalus]